MAVLAGPFTVGVIAAASWVPWLLIGLPAGAWIDRLPRRPVLLGCDAVSAAALVSVPVAAWLGVLTVAQLIVVAVLAGASSVLFSTAYRVYLPVLVAPADLPEGNAQLAGRSLAGVLAQWAGAVAGLLVDAVTFLVSAGCLAAISAREPPRPAVRRPSTLRREIADGLRWVAHDRYLRSLAVFSAVANVALTGYQAIQVVFFVQDVGVAPGAVGVLVAPRERAACSARPSSSGSRGGGAARGACWSACSP